MEHDPKTPKPCGAFPVFSERLVEIDGQLLGHQKESIIFEQQITCKVVPQFGIAKLVQISPITMVYR